MHFLRFTSGATLLPIFMVNMAAGHFPHMCVSAEVGRWISSCRSGVRVSLLADCP